MPELTASGTFRLDEFQAKALRAQWGSPVEKELLETMVDQLQDVYKARLVDAADDIETAELRARVRALREFMQLVGKTAASGTLPPPPSDQTSQVI